MTWHQYIIGLLCLNAAVAFAPSARAEPPVLSVWSSNLAAMPNEYFSLTVDVSDPDGDPLDIRSENVPPWAKSWTYQSGGAYYLFLYGVPSTEDWGVYSNVRIVASDGQTTVSTPPLEISVGAPRIEVSSALATIPNQYIQVTAYADHPSGKALQVGIENAPPWAAFWSYDTGSSYYMFLYGTPSVEDVGVYPDVRLTVSDGRFTMTRDLEVAVAIEGGRTLSLSWLAPTENEDGTPLTDLVGYQLYAWPPNRDAPWSAILHSSRGTQFELSGLHGGLWKLAMTAYNAAGEESALSNVVPVLVAETTP